MNIDLTARLESQRALLKRAYEVKEEKARILKEHAERKFLKKYEPEIRRIIEEIMDAVDKNAKLGKGVTVVGVLCNVGIRFSSNKSECWTRIMQILRQSYAVVHVSSHDYDIVFDSLVQTSRKEGSRKYVFELSFH